MKEILSLSWTLFFLSYIVFFLIFMQIDLESIPQEPRKSWAPPSVEVSAYYFVSERSGGVFWWSEKLGRKNCKVWWVIFSISDSDLWATCAQLKSGLFFCMIGSIHSYIKLIFYMYINILEHFMPLIFSVYAVFMKANSYYAAKYFAVNSLPCS